MFVAQSTRSLPPTRVSIWCRGSRLDDDNLSFHRWVNLTDKFKHSLFWKRVYKAGPLRQLARLKASVSGDDIVRHFIIVVPGSRCCPA